MTPELFQALLEQSESVTLDFKREQYRFNGATDEEKAELLKDILMFANLARTANAYIIVGVEEKSVPPHDSLGIVSHLEDNNIQQFVNKKTNAPVKFAVESFAYDGKEFDIIVISHMQQRPIFLKENFGKLHRNTVFLRQGSTCVEADPIEIMRMMRNLKISISPTRKGKQQLAQIRIFNRGPGPILVEQWWMEWGINSPRGGSGSVYTEKGRLPIRIEEQSTAELLVEIGDNLEELCGLGVIDADQQHWFADANQMEIFKHQAISHRLPPLPNAEQNKTDSELEAIKACKVEVEAKSNPTANNSSKSLDVVFKNLGNVPIPIAGAKISWTYTPPRPTPHTPGKPKVAKAGGSLPLQLQSKSKLVNPGEEVIFVLEGKWTFALVELLRGDVRDEDIHIIIGTTNGLVWTAAMDEIPDAVKSVAQSVLEYLHHSESN